MFLGLAGIVAVGVLLRVWNLDNERPYWDEIVSLKHLDAPCLTTFLAQERFDDPPMVPGYFTMEYFWARLTGGSVVGMRWLSVLLGTASIIMIFVLGTALYDAVVGLVAALCVALSVTHIYYATEIRPYALVMLLSLVSAFALLRGLRENGKRWWVVNIACNILVMWTHLFTVFFLLAQGGYLLAHSIRHRRLPRFVLWGLAQFPSVVLLLFWVRSIDHTRLDVAAVWRLKVVHSYLQLLGDFLLCIGAGVPTFRDVVAFGHQNIGGIMWRVFLPILLWAIVATFIVWWRSRPRSDPSVAAFWFLFPWLVVPPAALFLVSACVYTCHSSRYIMSSSIPFAILVGAAVKHLRIRALQIVAVCFLIGIYGFNVYLHPGPWRHDFRSVSTFLKSHMEKDARLLVYHTVDVDALQFEGGSGVFPETVKRFGELDEVRDFFASGQFREITTPAWLVLALRVSPGRDVEAVESAIEASAKAVDRYQFGYVRPVWVFRVEP